MWLTEEPVADSATEQGPKKKMGFFSKSKGEGKPKKEKKKKEKKPKKENKPKKPKSNGDDSDGEKSGKFGFFGEKKKPRAEYQAEIDTLKAENNDLRRDLQTTQSKLSQFRSWANSAPRV